MGPAPPAAKPKGQGAARPQPGPAGAPPPPRRSITPSLASGLSKLRQPPAQAARGGGAAGAGASAPGLQDGAAAAPKDVHEAIDMVLERLLGSMQTALAGCDEMLADSPQRALRERVGGKRA